MYEDIEKIRLESEFELAEFLKENNYISESVYESHMIDRKHTHLFEASSEDPNVASGIQFNHFKIIWNDFETFPTSEDVFNALFPDETKDVQLATKKRRLNRMIDTYEESVPEAKKLKGKGVGERKKLVEEFFRKKTQDVADEVEAESSVDPGQQGRKSNTGNIEQMNDLIPGELYSDITRIPKRRWGAWWARFIRRKTSLEPPKQAITSLRRWTRHFILGYQINPKIAFEVWYNSQNSTFSIHDQNGNPVRNGAKIPVMRDALNLLFQNVTQQAPEDVEFFRSSSPELKRVNLGLEREGQLSQKNADEEAKRMRRAKEERLAALFPDQDEQDAEAKKARRNASSPDRKDKKFSKKDAENHEERGKNQRKKEEERSNAGQDNRASDKAAAAMGKVNKKMKEVRKDLAERARKAQERERRRDRNNDPGNSQGSNTGSSQGSQRSNSGDNVIQLPFVEIEGERIEDPAEIASSIRDAGRNPNLDLDNIRFGNMPQTLKNDLKSIFTNVGEIQDFENGETNQLALVDQSGSDEDARETSNNASDNPEDTDGDDELSDVTKRPDNEQRRRNRRNEEPDLQTFADENPDVFSDNDEFGAGLDDDLGSGLGDDPLDFGAFENLINKELGIVKEDDENQIDKTIATNVDLGDPESNPLYDSESNQRVTDVREKAKRSQFTRQMVSNMFFEGLVKEYFSTRSRRYRTILAEITDWFKIFRGRNEKISIPTSVVTRRRRIRGFFSGTQARSDFIIGFSIKDEINFEIWYVQEISDDAKQQLASFYVYDVSAEKIIKSNIPFYRNALSAIVQKIGKDDIPTTRKNK